MVLRYELYRLLGFLSLIVQLDDLREDLVVLPGHVQPHFGIVFVLLLLLNLAEEGAQFLVKAEVRGYVRLF